MKKKKITARTILKIFSTAISMLLIAGIGLPAFGENTSPPTKVIIGALFDLSGDWSSLGESSEVALDVALKDVQPYLSRIGSAMEVKLIVEDTAGNPLLALQKLKGLAEQGVKVVIGPQSSAEVEAVKEYADRNGVLIISQGSTAHSLAIEQDNILRFCPDDISEGQIITELMWQDGIRAVVPIWRDDAGNKGLYVAMKEYFEARGGLVLDGVSYHPNSKDFSREVALLNSETNEAIVKYGLNSVGIYAAAFNEVASILEEALVSTNLSYVRWYGSNGIALSSALVSNSQAAQFAMKSGFPCPVFGLDKRARDKWEPLSEEISARIGRGVDAFTLAAYDAFWVAILTYATGGSADDFDTFKQTLLETAASYYGTTGWTALNDAGDRKEYNYDFWGVEEYEGSFQWKRVAQYQFDPDSSAEIIFMPSPHLPPLKILIVNSYKDWKLEEDLQKGVIEGLRRKGYRESSDYELKAFSMDTKITYTTVKEIEERASVVFNLIEEFKPSIVFVNNDNALKYVAVEYTERYPDRQLPFVFSGINLDPIIYQPISSLEEPKGPITGVLERHPYYQAFSFAKRIFPDASNIVLLADHSPSSDFVVQDFKERYLEKVTNSPLEVVDFIQIETFDEWKEIILKYQEKVDIIGIENYHQIRDANGKVVLASQVLDWTIQNSKIPELGSVGSYVEDGALLAIGPSYYKSGIYAGIIGGEILQGSAPGGIAIVDPGVVETAFNLERAKMLQIEIPIKELVQADEISLHLRETRS